MEAVAAEVAVLRRHFRSSFTWGLSDRHWLLLSWKRGWCVHPRLHLVFRALTAMLEPAFDLNHVVGSLGDWFYLAGSRRRPTLLTMAVHQPPVGRSLLDRVDRFVVETPSGREELQRLGICGQRMHLVFPPVDLERFRPATRTTDRFTALFASSPELEDWLDARGVPQLLDAARLRPDIRFRLLWRPWGNSLPRVRRWIREGQLANVELIVERSRDMARHYQHAHVTVAAFTDARRCKPAPNSVTESLACGRPVLLTPSVGLASVVEQGGAGITCRGSGEALADGLDRLKADWNGFAHNARALAERCFGVPRFVAAYQRVYDQLLRRAHAA
jgi:glycosyltransferase involved in cell wall biosynthesis